MTDFRALCAELLEAVDDLPWEYDFKGNPVGPLAEIDDAPFERARAALAQPEGEGPSDEELGRFLAERHRARMESESAFGGPDFDGAKARAARIADTRAALACWGRPTPQPIPVSERPWEREGWCDAEGRCYGWDGDYWWMVGNPGSANETITHWLPHWALPLPQSK